MHISKILPCIALIILSTSSLAQRHSIKQRHNIMPLANAKWIPKAERPYQDKEIFYKVSIYQEIPQIRAAEVEVAYRGIPKSKEAAALDVCRAYGQTLRTRNQGAAVRNYQCQPGVGLSKYSKKNTVTGTTVAHYHKGKTIVENVTVVATACGPKETYDPKQHICIPLCGSKYELEIQRKICTQADIDMNRQGRR